MPLIRIKSTFSLEYSNYKSYRSTIQIGTSASLGPIKVIKTYKISNFKMILNHTVEVLNEFNKIGSCCRLKFTDKVLQDLLSIWKSKHKHISVVNKSNNSNKLICICSKTASCSKKIHSVESYPLYTLNYRSDQRCYKGPALMSPLHHLRQSELKKIQRR